MRIVSLVPSATEILFALDLGECVVGVSHECDYPPEAGTRPVVVRAALDPGLPSRELDRRVSQALARGRSLYVVDVEALRALEPDLIVTQDLCQVCAAGCDDVADLVRELPGARVVTVGAQRLEGVLEDVRTLARAAGVPERGERLARALARRLTRTAEAAAACPGRPRVACIEWLDPPFVAGHWVPEMVELAAGTDVLGTPGRPSYRTDWEEVRQADPDVVVLMPCGFSIRGIRARLHELAADPAFRRLRAVREGQVWAVNAGAHFSRPGPRLVEGLEVLAAILHPEHFGEPAEAVRIAPRELGIPARP